MRAYVVLHPHETSLRLQHKDAQGTKQDILGILQDYLRLHSPTGMPGVSLLRILPFARIFCSCSALAGVLGITGACELTSCVRSARALRFTLAHPSHVSHVLHASHIPASSLGYPRASARSPQHPPPCSHTNATSCFAYFIVP